MDAVKLFIVWYNYSCCHSERFCGGSAWHARLHKWATHNTALPQTNVLQPTYYSYRIQGHSRVFGCSLLASFITKSYTKLLAKHQISALHADSASTSQLEICARLRFHRSKQNRIQFNATMAVTAIEFLPRTRILCTLSYRIILQQRPWSTMLQPYPTPHPPPGLALRCKIWNHCVNRWSGELYITFNIGLQVLSKNTNIS